jgi:hypothetical protein
LVATNPVFIVTGGSTLLVKVNLTAERAVLLLFIGIKAIFANVAVLDFLLAPKGDIVGIS